MRFDVLRVASFVAALLFLFLASAAAAVPHAISCSQGIQLNGYSLRVDSFDSSDPNQSTGGLYDPRKAGDSAEVASAGGITNSLPIGNVLIYGRLYTGSNSTVMLGTNGGIGTHSWLAENAGVEPGYELNSVALSFPDTTTPYSTGAVPGAGDIVSTPGITNHYDHVLYGGDYVATDLAGATIVMGDARLVLSNGLHMAGNDAITIAPGAGLVMYCGGSSCAIGGNSILNQNGFAEAVVVFCSASVTNVNFNGNASFIGMLVAPNADMSLNSAGSSTVDVSGALMVRSLSLNGNFNVDLDQALTATATLLNLSVSPGAGIQFNVSGLPGFHYAVESSTDLTSWTALVTNASPFTFSDTTSSGSAQRFYRARYSP